MTAASPKSQPTNATPGPWEISEVRSVEGEYLIVGGEGHDFGLIASCPMKTDAEAIVAAQARIEELEGALRFYAEPKNWVSTSVGFHLQYDPVPPPVQRDRGIVAIAALNHKGAA